MVSCVFRQSKGYAYAERYPPIVEAITPA
jgi:hypothetical protein